MPTAAQIAAKHAGTVGILGPTLIALHGFINGGNEYTIPKPACCAANCAALAANALFWYVLLLCEKDFPNAHRDTE